MNFNPVAWFEIYVDDMGRAKRFYESVFEVVLESLDDPEEESDPDCPSPEMWAFPMFDDAPGAAGALAKMEGVSAGGNSVLVYFSCEDCAVQEKRASEAGGAVMVGKKSIGKWGFISVVQDTEGNMIGLHSLQ